MSNVHSIDFFYDDPINEEAEGRHVNTWDDWHIVAQSRPTISPPEFKENNVEIAGMSGFVDVSRVLTGYPLYGARKGSIDFIVLNDYNTPDAKPWTEIYREMVHFLHGQRRKMVLHDDERNYYYDGIFKVDSFESGEFNSTVTISYILQPYKKARRLSNEEWLWDPFDLDYGITVNRLFMNWETEIPLYPDTDVNSRDFSDYVGDEPVVPEFYVTFDIEYEVGPDTRTFVYPDVNNDGKIDSSDTDDIMSAVSRINTGGQGFYDIFKPVTGDTAPTFAPNTYYSFEEFGREGGYVLLETEPDDWSTNWTDYYYLFISAEEQFDRADTDRDGKVTQLDVGNVLSFYSAISVGEYTDDLAGWTDFMQTKPIEVLKEVQIRTYARTVEGRVTNNSITVASDGSVYGDDVSIELASEDMSKRTFKVKSPHVIFYGETIIVRLQGYGTVDISFREGRL